MRLMLWRMAYVALAFAIFYLVAPLFLSVVGFPALSAQVLQLLKLLAAIFAVLYVLFGPAPKTLF